MKRTRRPADLTHRFEGDSVSRALALIGDQWTLLILREALFRVRRYGQLARNLGIPRPTLSARLRSLVDSGLLERVAYAHDPERHEYRLTEAGRELFGAAVMLMRWGDRCLAGPRRTADRPAPPRVRRDRRPNTRLRQVRQGDHPVQRHTRGRSGRSERDLSGMVAASPLNRKAAAKDPLVPPASLINPHGQANQRAARTPATGASPYQPCPAITPAARPTTRAGATQRTRPPSRRSSQ